MKTRLQKNNYRKNYFLLVLILALSLASTLVNAQLVSTFAGSGTAGSVNDVGVDASFNNPSGLVRDASGNIYVADVNNHLIRKITSSGVVSTFAGSGSAGSSDGNGASASFNYPNALAIDALGNLYVSDFSNHLIRKISPSADVTTFAGSGSIGSSDGTGAGASFNSPTGVAVDASDNVYVADNSNNKIRKITPAGVVTTFAGSGSIGSSDGTGTGASFNSPFGVAVDGSGNVYVGDRNNYKIRKITSAGVVTTFAGTGSSGSIDGLGTTASFSGPSGMTIDGSGNIYLADIYNHKIRKITPAGVVSTLAGSGAQGSDDGIATFASFYRPVSVCIDAIGDLFVSDTRNNKIRYIKISREIKVSQGSTELISGSSTFNFGNITSLTSSSAINFTIENITPASSDISLTGSPLVTLSGSDASSFSVDLTGTSTMIAAVSSTSFTITFSPQSIGNKTAIVTVLNNDADESTYTFTITGTGIETNPTSVNNKSETSVLLISPNPTNGEIIINTTQALTLSIYDAQGVKVIDQTIEEGNTLISLEKLKAGLYTVHCTDKNGKHQESKIIKYQ